MALINFSGSFLLGFFLIGTGERVLADRRWRLLGAIGLCGSYTTFSSHAFETYRLGGQGQWLLADLNVVGSNLLCLAAVLAAAALAGWILNGNGHLRASDHVRTVTIPNRRVGTVKKSIALCRGD